MYSFVFIILTAVNLILSDQPINKFEIQFKDGKVVHYFDFGKSSKIPSKLGHFFQIKDKESIYWLRFEKISEVSFKSIKEKTIVADVLLSSGKVRKFEIVRDRYYCKKADCVLEISLASIKKITLIKQ